MRKKPMLAYPVSDKPINYENDIFIQPKLDGVRCLIQYDAGKEPHIHARVKSGKILTIYYLILNRGLLLILMLYSTANCIITI